MFSHRRICSMWHLSVGLVLCPVYTVLVFSSIFLPNVPFLLIRLKQSSSDDLVSLGSCQTVHQPNNPEEVTANMK